MKKMLIALFALLALPALAIAAGGGSAPAPSNANINDSASLQRGARLFMNYCVSCHSIEFMRYSRIAQDLGLSEAQVMENLNFTGAKFGETIHASMSGADAAQWFGKAPPDLSLTARARGVDWIYDYLKSFYWDEKAGIGWNNTRLPNASMPHVLWELQGVQRPVYTTGPDGQTTVSGLVLPDADKSRAASYDAVARDIANFMQYVGEPAAVQRQSIGVWVILFLALFTFIAWMLKHEFWRDVH
jgi:ubiquinol-cytochrome c reductase cytochrome c1 subunit